jgi:hypothetical protein
MNFAVQSLPLAFSSKNINLNRSLSTIFSISNEPSNAGFEDQIDELGFVHKFSVYTIPLAGKHHPHPDAISLSLGLAVTR